MLRRCLSPGTPQHARQRLGAAIVALLALSACVDTGPATEAQISQDIQADLWTSNQLPPVVPGTPPPIATGDESRRVIP
jgi:hypothetical protein